MVGRYRTFGVHEIATGGKLPKFFVPPSVASPPFAAKVMWVHPRIEELVGQKNHFDYDDIIARIRDVAV